MWGGEKGYLLIRYIWTQGTDSIHDKRVVNTDAIFYQSKTPENSLETDEGENKRKYLNACLNECRHFTPFSALVCSLPRVEVKAMIKRIASRLAQKWKEP